MIHIKFIFQNVSRPAKKAFSNIKQDHQETNKQGELCAEQTTPTPTPTPGASKALAQ